MTDTYISTDGTITITFGSGASISFPDADSWGVGPSYPSWHEYYAEVSVGRLSDGWTVSGVWNNLLSQPAPGVLIGGAPASTGSITDTFGPGGVQHIVDPINNIVVNMTLSSQQWPGSWTHPLHPGAVIRHVTIDGGFVVIQSVGIGNFDGFGPLSVFVNDLMGDFSFGGPGQNTLELLASPHQCFPASTPVAISPTETRPISDIRVGDTVLAFDPAADLGRGALVPRKVVRLYQNTTEEWVKLTWSEGGEAKELVATPGHHFLDQFGNFPTIEEMLENGRATVVLASGELTEATAERIVQDWADDAVLPMTSMARGRSINPGAIR